MNETYWYPWPGPVLPTWSQIEAAASILGITAQALWQRLTGAPPPPAPPPAPPPPPPGPIAGGDTLTGPDGTATLFGAAAPDATETAHCHGGRQTWTKTVTTTTTESNTITRGVP